MDERVLTCPFCGFEFAPTDAACEHGCPLHTACNLTRCPLCDYEFPAVPRTLSRLERFFARRRKRAAERRRGRCLDRAGGLVTVHDLAGGDRAEVLHLEDADPERSNALAVFGLVPGCVVTLVQRRPSFVLQVGETLLALDAEIAGTIVVAPLAA